MRYEDMPEFGQYKELLEKIKKETEPINEKKSYRIAIDGKDASKYHNNDFMSPYGYTANLVVAAEKIIKKYKFNCQLFAINDEVNIFFQSGQQFIDTIEIIEDKVLTQFLLEFHKEFRLYKRDALFKAFMHKINKKDIPVLLNFLKMRGKYTNIEYLAKEKFGKDYPKDDVNAIIEKLKEHGFWEEFEQNEIFSKGIYREYKFEEDVEMNVDDTNSTNMETKQETKEKPKFRPRPQYKKDVVVKMTDDLD